MLLALLACAADPSATVLPAASGDDDFLPAPEDRVPTAGPAPTFSGPDELSGSDGYACHVASAGDVNADGYDDVLVVDCAATTVAVHMGSAAGVSMTAARTLTGRSADGYAASIAGRGDLDGDGYADIAIGAPARNGGRGCVSVLYGTATGIHARPDITVCGPVGAAMGGNVDIVGDVNGDGYDDLAASSGAGGSPLLRVYYGSATGIDASTFTGVTLPADFDSSTGQSLRRAGDLNGDGYADVAIGAPDTNGGAGSFRVYYGSATGISSTNRFGAGLSTAWWGTAAQGHSISAAGDVDGDGYGDLLVGAPWVPYYGAAFVYFGSPTGLAAGDVVKWYGDVGYDADYSGTGYSVVGDADFNGDSYADIVVTVPARWNGGYGIPAGSWGASEVYVGDPSFFSTCHGLCSPPTDALLLGKAASGGQVDIGDVNGDGCDDLIESESWDWGSLSPFYYEANVWYGNGC